MAQFTFEVPDDAAARISNAVCSRFGYDPDSNQTPVEFTASVVFRWLRDVTLLHEADQAADAARSAVLDNPDDPLLNLPT
jgi:hypothetical protein